jgi:hypothetical protein
MEPTGPESMMHRVPRPPPFGMEAVPAIHARLRALDRLPRMDGAMIARHRPRRTGHAAASCLLA